MPATTGESDSGRNLAVKRILPPYIDKTFESSVTARLNMQQDGLLLFKKMFCLWR